MVCSRTVPPHKCSGIEGCFQNTPNIWGLPRKQTCSNCHRQYHFCSIHKQTVRHPFMGTLYPSLAYSGLVSSTKHCSNCQAHSRLLKCDCRPVAPAKDKLSIQDCQLLLIAPYQQPTSSDISCCICLKTKGCNLVPYMDIIQQYPINCMARFNGTSVTIPLLPG